MDSRIIAALIGLAGVSLGALFGGVGYYLKSRDERQKDKKAVLYHLLEFRHLLKVSRINSEQQTAKYIEYCRTYFSNKLGINVEGNFPEDMRSLIEDHFETLIETLKPKIDDSFIESYETALSALCKTEPVLAFRLRGKERVEEIFQVKEKYEISLKTNIFSKEKANLGASIEKHLKKASDNVSSQLVDNINRDILMVAKSCSVFTWFSCKQITRENITSDVEFGELGIEELLDEMYGQIKAEASDSVETKDIR